MKKILIRGWLSLMLLGSAAANAAETAAFSLAPSAELRYTIKAKQSGIPVSGNATVQWQADDKKYSVHSETRAMLIGKILDTGSRGSIDNFGLAPDQFNEKRFNKPETITTFDRAKKTLKFSASEQTYTLKGGEQDRSSAVWQVIALIRANPDKAVTGQEWKLFVAGRRDADPWTFRVVGNETLQTAMGPQACLHLSKAPPADSKDQQLDIWLAPGLDWYPVRLRFSDADGDFVDQTLESLKKTGTSS